LNRPYLGALATTNAPRAVLNALNSSELTGLLGLCDRILAMFRGRLVAEVHRSEANEEGLIYYATGQGQA
jgi:ABC-type sugar transport system ATPase subunit